MALALIPIMLGSIPNLYQSYYLYLLLTLIACFILFTLSKYRQRKELLLYQKILISTLSTAFIPFIISYTGFIPRLYEYRFHTLYLFLFFPIISAYLLWRHNTLNIRFSINVLISKGSFYLITFLLTSTVCLVILRWNIADFHWLILVIIGFSFLRDKINLHLEERKIKETSQAKERLEKEKLEIIQKLNYNQFLSSLSSMIQSLIFEVSETNGNMIICREGNHHYVFTQSGIFKNYRPNGDLRRLQDDDISMLTYQSNKYLSFPLQYQNKHHGWLILGEKKNKERFSSFDLKTLTDLSETICELICLSDLLNKNQTNFLSLYQVKYEKYLDSRILSSNEKFRKQIVNFLHDELLQPVLISKNFASGLDTPQHEIKNIIISQLQTLAESLRNKMFDIYPSSIEKLGLYQALATLCAKTRNQIQIEDELNIKFQMDSEISIPNHLTFTIFRITKELLQNAMKHAYAKEIIINIKIDDSIIFLNVLDDGNGFNIRDKLENEKFHDSIGLLSIQQDVNSFGGEFLIDSTPNVGTFVRIKIPF